MSRNNDMAEVLSELEKNLKGPLCNEVSPWESQQEKRNEHYFGGVGQYRT